MNNIIKRIAYIESLLKRLLNSNQLGRIVVRDQKGATITIRVYDASNTIRVYIGKK